MVVFPCVYRRPGLRLTKRGWQRAAMLACGPESHLGYECAGDVADLKVSRRLEVIVPPDVNLRIPGIRIRRCIVEDADRDVIDGLRVTAWPRTILDCCTVCGIKTIRAMLDRTVRPLEVYDAHLIEALLERHPRRAGRKKLRSVHGWVTDRGDETLSDEEVVLDHALRELGATGYWVNDPILTYFGDFHFRAERPELRGRRRAARGAVPAPLRRGPRRRDAARAGNPDPPLPDPRGPGRPLRRRPQGHRGRRSPTARRGGPG